MKKDLIFSLALFPTIDGALLRRTLSTGHQRRHSKNRRLYVLMFISTSLKCIDVCPLLQLHLKIEMRCLRSLVSFKKENGQKNKYIFKRGFRVPPFSWWQHVWMEMHIIYSCATRAWTSTSSEISGCHVLSIQNPYWDSIADRQRSARQHKPFSISIPCT